MQHPFGKDLFHAKFSKIPCNVRDSAGDAHASMATLMILIIPIFMIDVSKKSTVKKIELIEKSAKKLIYSLIDDRFFIYDKSSIFY